MAEHSQQTVELFAQIGARLKSAREERGYSLQELASHTRINALFLGKIEAGELEGMPGIAFVKGFIRNYVNVLQLQDAELDEAVAQLGPRTAREQATLLQPSNPQVLDTDVPKPAYWRMALFGVLAIAILWVGYVLFSGSGTTPPTSAPATVTPAAPAPSAPAPVAPGAEMAPTPTPGTTSAPSGGTPGTAPRPPGQGANVRTSGTGPVTTTVTRPTGPLEGRQKLEMTIRGLERTWVRVSVDRAPPVDVLMQPAETVAWEANQEIRLTIGRSNGVAVYLNGEEILLPAEPNRLIPNLVLNKLTLLRLEN